MVDSFQKPSFFLAHKWSFPYHTDAPPTETSKHSWGTTRDTLWLQTSWCLSITVHCQQLSPTEHCEGHRHWGAFRKVPHPKYTLLGRFKLTRTLLPGLQDKKIWATMAKKLMTIRWVSLSPDSWTSIGNEIFITITCYGITLNYVLETLPQGCAGLQGRDRRVYRWYDQGDPLSSGRSKRTKSHRSPPMGPPTSAMLFSRFSEYRGCTASLTSSTDWSATAWNPMHSIP